MPNRLTRVPEGPVPLLPVWARWAVLPADAFMLLMVSRPETGSLARTWVTPATLRLCLISSTFCIAAIALMTVKVVVDSGGALSMVVLAVLSLDLIGQLCVALVGVAQRAASRD